jgi:hypothetical protein
MEKTRKPVTPIGDFNCQSFPLVDGNTYLISEDELEKLGKHELKWSTETYDEDGETKTRPILIENDPTEENTRNLAVQRIAELKKYLSDTDYIVTKIAEAETEEEKAELKTEYQAKLVLRKRWRKDINELQEYLNEESHID